MLKKKKKFVLCQRSVLLDREIHAASRAAATTGHGFHTTHPQRPWETSTEDVTSNIQPVKEKKKVNFNKYN